MWQWAFLTAQAQRLKQSLGSTGTRGSARQYERGGCCSMEVVNMEKQLLNILLLD